MSVVSDTTTHGYASVTLSQNFRESVIIVDFKIKDLNNDKNALTWVRRT